MKTELNQYDNSWYDPKKSVVIRLLWYFTNHLIFNNALWPVSGLKVFLLRLYGAKIGKKVNIKPSVNIKYPWLLHIGDYTWIGENVWIDNLTHVTIGKNVCISQGAFLLTGNHNYKKVNFDLMICKISLEDGVWVGARAVVCPGVTCHSHSILTVNAVATSDLDPYGIYAGNPAVKIKERRITS